jgi:hypothetical protein
LAYAVEFAVDALADANEYRNYILDHSHDSIEAEKWLDGMSVPPQPLRTFLRAARSFLSIPASRNLSGNFYTPPTASFF